MDQNKPDRVTITNIGHSVYDLRIGSASHFMQGTIRRDSETRLWSLITAGRIDAGYQTRAVAIDAFRSLFARSLEAYRDARR